MSEDENGLREDMAPHRRRLIGNAIHSADERTTSGGREEIEAAMSDPAQDAQDSDEADPSSTSKRAAKKS